MSYKIYLKNPSQLKFVCGLAIPNGYFHVMDMTFANSQQFANLKKAKGLAEVVIEDSTLKPGGYDNDGRKVNYESLKDWCWTFGNSPITYEVPEIPQESPTDAIDAITDPLLPLKEELEAKGIAYRKNASEKALRGLLATA